MATTQNTYTGNGSTTLYSFTFPYLKTADVKVTLDGVTTTAYTFATATSIQFTTAPSNGSAIRIYRVTDDSDLSAEFFTGSAIRAVDLNNNFTQNLYVTQEANRDVASAITVANAATTTANNAVSTANAATTTANTASATATSATATANSAVSTANSAVATANTASTSAANAVATANTANTNATAALSAAAEALAYSVVADVASIPISPSNGDAIRIVNSTGIESFTPLTSLPAGFTGDAGLTVEIYYSSSGSSWVWVRYYATDSDARYASLSDMTQAQSDILGLDTQKLDVTTIGTTVQAYDADTVKTDVLPTFTVATRTTERTITGSFDLATGNLWTCGAITVPNPTNAAAGQTGAIRITAGPVVWSSNFKFPAATAPTITTFPAVIPYYVQDASTILMGYVSEGIA